MNDTLNKPDSVARENLRQGTLFRNILNELKRDVPSAAQELGTSSEVLEAIIAGTIELPFDLIKRASEIWPINERDFFILRDDTKFGIKIRRAAESIASKRILKRGSLDYYEYRDTAMSKLAMFRPEWIEMLLEIEDQDPNNSKIKWNKGHFLYQFTFFIGDINYYYEWEGVKRCAQMKTGDSVFGLPYSPHTFAKRGPNQAFILALTFGSRLLGDCQQELLALGRESTERFASESIFTKHLQDSGMSLQALAAKIEMPEEVLQTIFKGQHNADYDTLSKIANGLQVSLRDLLKIEDGEIVNGVRFVKYKDAFSWEVPPRNPAYRIKELAGCKSLFGARALQIICLNSGHADDDGYLETGLHQYCYNISSTSIRVEWLHNDQVKCESLGPGDSLYVVPFVKLRFYKSNSNDSLNVLDNSLLVLRIPGKVGSDEIIEASFVGREALGRFVSDNQQWYQS